MIETTDLIFAIDSIPAVFAITQDPFLVFTSNIMAVLGLRSLYFAVAGIIDRFYYLRLSLSLILVMIGSKMLLKDVLHALPGTTYYTLGGDRPIPRRRDHRFDRSGTAYTGVRTSGSTCSAKLALMRTAPCARPSPMEPR